MTSAHTDASLALQGALAWAGGTVTSLLETWTGEAIDATRIAHAPVVATAANRLGVATGHALLGRQAVLRGRASLREYVYAETLLVPDRLPDGVPQLLETTVEPIGRLLEGRGFATTRTVLEAQARQPLSGDEARMARALFAWRSRVDHCGVAVMLIEEWFLPDLGEVIARRA